MQINLLTISKNKILFSGDLSRDHNAWIGLQSKFLKNSKSVIAINTFVFMALTVLAYFPNIKVSVISKMKGNELTYQE